MVIMSKKIVRIKMLISFVFMIVLLSCSPRESIEYTTKYKLNQADFESVLIMEHGKNIIESQDESLIKYIVTEINKGKKQYATEIAFEKGPEGLIQLKGAKEVEILYFY